MSALGGEEASIEVAGLTPEELSLVIIPSSNLISPGNMLNISYQIKNRSNFTLINLSLVAKEVGALQLNVSRLSPGQIAGAKEILRIEDKHLPGPFLRTTEVRALDPSGRILVANSTLVVDVGAGAA